MREKTRLTPWVLQRQTALHVAPSVRTVLGAWLLRLGVWRSLGLHHGDIGCHSAWRCGSGSSSLKNRAAGVGLIGTSPSCTTLSGLSPRGARCCFAHVLCWLCCEISLRRWHHQEQFGLLGNGGWLPVGRWAGGPLARSVPGAVPSLCLPGTALAAALAATLGCTILVTLTHDLGRSRKRACHGGRLAFTLHFIYAISGFQESRWL